jgi:recombination protein RecT
MENTNKTEVVVNTSLQPKAPTQSERFTNAVMAEFSSGVSDIALTNFQRKLCQSYFIKLDATLKEADKKRLSKSEQYRDNLPVTWENVNMSKLAIDVVCWSAIGLDPLQPNHINIIPYKNSTSGKFDIGFIPGYKGIEIKAKKYGFDIPDDVVVELVWSKDVFKQIKKDLNNKIESYIFEVVDDFNRGDIIGGFYYHSYTNNPEKNKIKVFTRADIEKRRPEQAAAEFWGGEKDEWKNGQKTGQKIKVEGWFEEMAWKTIYKAAFSVITIDSQKIDDAYLNVITRDAELIDNKVAIEIQENANKESLSFEEAEEVPIDEVKEVPRVVVTEEETTGPGF